MTWSPPTILILFCRIFPDRCAMTVTPFSSLMLNMPLPKSLLTSPLMSTFFLLFFLPALGGGVPAAPAGPGAACGGEWWRAWLSKPGATTSCAAPDS